MTYSSCPFLLGNGLLCNQKVQMSMRQQFLLQKWASPCTFVRHRKGHMVPWNHQALLTLSYLNWEHRERLALHCMPRQSIGTSGDEEAQFGSQTEKKSLSRWRSITKKGWDGRKRRHSWLQVSKSQLNGFSSPGQERWLALLFTWDPVTPVICKPDRLGEIAFASPRFSLL